MTPVPAIAPPVAPHPLTDHQSKTDVRWRWKPTVFGTDVTNTVRTSDQAEGREKNEVQKKRKTTNTGTQAASSSGAGDALTSEADTGIGSVWPWSRRIVCSVRDSNCRFSAAGTDEMRNHLSTAHNISKGKGTRLTVEGVKVPRERCPWGDCRSVLESSSLRKHLQANHIGAKKLWYVCGHCGKALGLEAKAQHEQGRCKGRQT